MDMPEGRLGEIWLAIKQLTTREGMTPEKISQDLAEDLGVSTPQEAYDLIHQALDNLPDGRFAEAIRYALGGEEYSPLASLRYRAVGDRHDVSMETARAWALKGAVPLARQLLNQATRQAVPSKPETVDITTVPDLLRLMEEQIDLLREIRDLLRK